MKQQPQSDPSRPQVRALPPQDDDPGQIGPASGYDDPVQEDVDPHASCQAQVRALLAELRKRDKQIAQLTAAPSALRLEKEEETDDTRVDLSDGSQRQDLPQRATGDDSAPVT